MDYVNKGEAWSVNQGGKRSAVGPHQVPGTAGEHRQGRTLEGGVETGMSLLHRRAPSLSQPRPSPVSATQVWRRTSNIVKHEGDVNRAVRADAQPLQVPLGAVADEKWAESPMAAGAYGVIRYASVHVRMRTRGRRGSVFPSAPLRMARPCDPPLSLSRRHVRLPVQVLHAACWP